MSSNTEREVFRALAESQRKYTYFLLTAAGAAIGFAVSQTQGEAISWSQVPLGLAVAAWGASFFFGCRHIGYVNSTLYANAEILKIEAGLHPEVGNHPQYMQAASEGIRGAIESNSEEANRFGSRQFSFLISGAVLYLVWHLLEMALRAISQGTP